LGVWDGSKYINDHTCNLNTGECFDGGGLVGQTCGSNLAGWTICETTITESNPGASIGIYNDNQIGHWSVYDLIEEPGSFDYNGITIKGSLLDEKNNILLQTGGKAPTCGGLGTRIPIDANITLEYYDGSWHQIGSPKFYDDFNDNNYNGWTVDAGMWGVLNGELNTSGGGGEEVIHTNWNGWNSNDYLSANIKIPSGNDVWLSLRNDSGINYYVQTYDGYKTLQLYITDEAGYYHAKSVDISALGINPNNWNSWRIEQKGSDMLAYINGINLINTSAEKTTIDNFESGNFIGWTTGCGGNTINTTADGYDSIYALNITSTGGDGLACANTPYNAIKGRKITYACYGGRCLLGVWDGSKYINDHTCNLNTGECFSGGSLVGQTCGSNLAGWTICETTITESNPGASIGIYNDNQIGHWSVYDLIEESIKVPIITNGRIQLRTSNPTIALFDDINVDGVIYKKDGSWSYPWDYVSVTTKLRATYSPLNWYYNYTSVEINLCDNDGVCDAGENCENCGDCTCLPGEHCCPGGFCFPIGPCPI
jgi:hypothetical protein